MFCSFSPRPTSVVFSYKGSDLAKDGADVSVKELTSTSFGYIIGFLLPGLFGLYGLGLWLRDVQDLLKPAASTDATIGPSFFLLLSALTMGLLLSAVRFFTFEKWICKSHSLDADIFKKLAGIDKLAAFNAVVEQHYRYHQFYGGCAVAVFIAFPRWLWDRWAASTYLLRFSLIAGFCLLETMLLITARDSFVRYVDRGNNIVRGDHEGK
jgi:hypothetical protein